MEDRSTAIISTLIYDYVIFQYMLLTHLRFPYTFCV